MEELQPEQEVNTNTEVQTETNQEIETKSSLGSFLNIEDLIKSEKEVKTTQEIKGLMQIESETQFENKEFAKKKDEKKSYAKKRLKIVTGVYIAVITMLLAFVGVNAVTLAILSKDATNNANTIQAKQEVIQHIDKPELGVPSEDFPINITAPPRDYNDDNKELSFWDKVTIVFKNLFG